MSTLTVSNIKKTGETASRDVSGVAAACINFNGTGTVAIRDSFNVSSIADENTGVYRTYFSSTFSASDYAVGAFTGGNGSVRSVVGGPTALTASSSQLVVTNSVEAVADAEIVTAATHGDLA